MTPEEKAAAEAKAAAEKEAAEKEKAAKEKAAADAKEAERLAKEAKDKAEKAKLVNPHELPELPVTAPENEFKDREKMIKDWDKDHKK